MLKDKLFSSGRPLLASFLGLPVPALAEACGRAGFDFLILDGEHGSFSPERVEACLSAADSVGLPVLMRVPEADATYIQAALDAGAQGVQVPSVESEEQARLVAQASRLPPQGRRGFGSTTRAAGYGYIPRAEVIKTAAKLTTVVQIESKRGVENLDAILAVEGIDAVFLGTSDLSVDYGYASPDDPAMLPLVQSILRTIVQANKPCGVHVTGWNNLPFLMGLGVRFFTIASLAVMGNSLKQTTQSFADKVSALSAEAGAGPCPPTPPETDVPFILLGKKTDRQAQARIIATQPGVLSGCDDMLAKARALDLQVNAALSAGQGVAPGAVIAHFQGKVRQIIKGEEQLLGELGKASGVATAAHKARQLAPGLKIVCGAWKKMPLEMKQLLRAALQHGGIDSRMLNEPFVYIDKNYLRLLASVPAALAAAQLLPGRSVVLQLRGETAPLETEVALAAKGGVQVIMVDTGRLADLEQAGAALKNLNLRQKVKLAFGGGVDLGQLPALADLDLDIVDMGRALIDAPLLDLRYEVSWGNESAS